MSKTRVVVLGGSGMLGHKVFQVLRETFAGTRAITRRAPQLPPLHRVELLQGNDVICGVDAQGFGSLDAMLRQLTPEVIVNCIGIIKQRDQARTAVPSILVNALLPHQLAETAAAWGGRVIHVSSDCVFSGLRGNYSEDDASDADDIYGKTKSLGEVVAPNAVTLRTSIIGRELMMHRSLLDWFLSQNGKKVRGYRKVIYSGVTTNELALVIERLIADFPSLSGLFQVVSDPITKCELLSLIREAYGLDIEIEPYDAEVSDRSMCGFKFHEATGWRAPAWPELVRRLAADPTPYSRWIGSEFPEQVHS